MLRFEGEKPSTATMTTKQVCERGGTAVGTRVTTTGIRFFAECRRLCRVLFIGHSAKKSLPSATLGKFRLSRQRYPLPSAEHSAQDALGNDTFAEGQTLGKGGSRQSAVSGRPPADDRQSLPRANRWHSAKRILCRVPHSRHSAKRALPSVCSRHSAKYIFIFLFCLSKFLWYVPTLCRPTCIICGQF
jgi:hypothetical protein